MSVHILLTGGTGFFGTSLLRYIHELGVKAPRLTIVSRNPIRFVTKNPELADLADWVQADVLSYDTLPTNKRFTHILHAAADYTVSPKLSSLQHYTQIIDGTRNILKLAVATGATRFLFTSSGAVYGPQPTTIEEIPETYTGTPESLNPLNAYALAKQAAEHLCVQYQEIYGLNTVIARCFTFIGRDMPLNAPFAIGNFLKDALWGDEISIHSDGSAIRSYLDQHDLAAWLLTILDRGKSNRVYNVGSDQSISIKQLAITVRDLISPGKPVTIHEKSNLIETIRLRYVPDISRAKNELGLNITISLNEAITRAAKAIVVSTSNVNR